jgi:hypothetical protein
MNMGLGLRGSPGFHLDDERGVIRYRAHLTPEGEANVRIQDRDRKTLFLASEEPGGRGHIQLLDPEGTPRFDAGYEKSSYVELHDEKGELTFEAPPKK